MAKRDLGKLGVTELTQLETPLPPGIRCSVKLALRKNDDGTTYNRVRGFDVLGIDDDPNADPDFAPPPRSGQPDTTGPADTATAKAVAPTGTEAEANTPAARLIDTAAPTRAAMEAGR